MRLAQGHLAEVTGRTPLCRLPRSATLFAGGDQIVSEGFRLIGQTSRLRSASSRYGGESTLLAADRRIGELDNRPVCYWGYRRQDLFEKPAVDAQESRAGKNTADSNLERDLDWQTANDLLGDLSFSHLRPDLVTTIERCESHVDRYVSPTGLRHNGKHLLLLADPVAVAPEAISKAKREKRLLDASEHWLRDQGFEIIRNPVPFGVDVKNAVRPRLYNNVLLENAVRGEMANQSCGCHASVKTADLRNSMRRTPGFGRISASIPNWSSAGKALPTQTAHCAVPPR